MDAAQKVIGSALVKRTRKPQKPISPSDASATVASDASVLGAQGDTSTLALPVPSDASVTPFYICGYPVEIEPWSERELAHIQKLRTEYLSWPLPDLETAIASGEAEIANPNIHKDKFRVARRYLEAFRSAAHHVRRRQTKLEANHGSDNPRVPDAVA